MREVCKTPGCNEKLQREMERDEGLCVQCQKDRYIREFQIRLTNNKKPLSTEVI